MIIGKYLIGPRVIVARLFNLLSYIWFIPFGFYAQPIKTTGTLPHPFKPRHHRDLILNKMMFPDNTNRAVIADKLAARGWVAKRVGKQHLIPLQDICFSPDDLRLEEYKLPFIVKTNHASGQNIIVNSLEDFDGIHEKTAKWLAADFAPKLEWVYRDIEPCILVEDLLTNDKGEAPANLRIHCFFGEIIYIARDRKTPESYTHGFFNKDWVLLNVSRDPKVTITSAGKPKHFDRIIKVAETLSADFDYIRVDLYEHDNQVYFGELTNFHQAGTVQFNQLEFDRFLIAEYERLKTKSIVEQRDHYASVGSLKTK